MNKSLRSNASKRRKGGRSKTLKFWQTTNLFVYKPVSVFNKDWNCLRTKQISLALVKNHKALASLGLTNSKELISKYIYVFEKMCNEKGVLYTCKFLKQIYSYCQRYTVSHISEPIPFTKLNSKGVPSIVGYLTTNLRGSIQERRNALCILQLYKLVKTNNKLIKYDSIRTEPLVNRDEVPNEVGAYFESLKNKFPNQKKAISQIKEAYLTVLEECFPRKKTKERINEVSKRSDIYISGKRGPNGPSLTHSALDFECLRSNSPNLLNNIKEISTITNNRDLNDIIERFEEDEGITISKIGSEKLVDSKLSLKQESGGKNRVFAIGDWFTQSSLKGFHLYLFNWLSFQEEDGTKDHNRTALISKEWSKVQEVNPRNLLHSVDLTTATDCCPSLLQREIVHQILGKEFSDHWYSLMTERSFKKINCDEFITYTTGQPMGLLSSWAMLAVWHHIILRTILKILKIPRFDSTTGFVNYLIIGDDVAMRGRNIYKYYLLIVNKLCGIPISELKGFTPETLDMSLNPLKDDDNDLQFTNTISAIEIAKRVFVNGAEVTPVSPVAIQMGLRWPSDFPSLLDELLRRGYNQIQNPTSARTLLDLNFNPSSALSLSTFPLGGASRNLMFSNLNESDPILGKSPWLRPDWNESENNRLVQIVIKSMRNRLNTGIGDVYNTLMPYMDFDCYDEPIQLTKGYEITSSGLNTLLNRVYRKCQDLIRTWATDFTKEGTKEFWTGTSPNPLEFKRYLGRMHVIFDIQLALSGETQVLDEKRFSSKFFYEIVKDFIKESKDQGAK